MSETPRRRNWFGFSIRDLLWLTVVVGVVLTWRIDRGRVVEESMNWEHRAAVAKSMLKDDGVDLNWSEKVVHRSQGNGFTKKYILDRKAPDAIPASWTPPAFPASGGGPFRDSGR
jgi:hypothetical protein